MRVLIIIEECKSISFLPAGSSSVTMIWPVQGAEVPGGQGKRSSFQMHSYKKTHARN